LRPAGGALLAVAAAVVVLALQPVRAPWWIFADPDGAYVGSSLNILLGNHTNYLDHPGLPTQDVLTLGFGAEYLVGKATGKYDDRQAFVNEKMLDLDSARALYRTWAIALFLGATLLVYVVVARLLGHWTWGLAGSLAFVSAPGLGAISFLLRPDPALAALCLAIGYLTVTGFDRRSTLRYTGAAALLGFTMTVKLSAAGMIVPLILAAAWRAPGTNWFRDLMRTLGSWARANASWLVPAALVWFVLCVVFNRERLPIVQTDDQRSILVNGGTFLVGYTLFAFATERFRIPWADRIFRLAYAWLMLAFVVGMAIPATLVLDDGVQALVAMKETLTGKRVNEGVDPFANFTTNQLTEYPLSTVAIVIGLGVVAGAIGLKRRQYWPFFLALGSVALGAMAAARYSLDYYYAPAFAVAIPGALWILRRGTKQTVPVYVWIGVLVLFGWSVSTSQTWEPQREVEIDAAAQKLADELLEPGEVMLVGYYYFSAEDVRFGSLVDGFVDHVPEYPYRLLSRPRVAGERGLVPRYVLGGDELPDPGERMTLDIDGSGPFVLEGLPQRWGPEQGRIARIVESPSLESS
jgi:hypothetical protein